MEAARHDLRAAGVPRSVGAILLCECAGAAGTLATRDSINDWYRQLDKPRFNPPDWIFGPVWTVLYALMGLGLAIVSARGGEDARPAQIVFGLQLALNTAWTFIFFGRRAPGAALIEIVLLWIAIVVTIALFFRISRLAGLLLVPYLLWTTFATVLNASIWRRNS